MRVAALKDDCLILVTPSAGLATKLRMDKASILKTIQATVKVKIIDLKIRTAPITPAMRLLKTRRELPVAAIRSLERYAKDSGDQELQDQISNRKKGDQLEK